jgi:putative component of membrane protein insertase Oxa1/YidC/SpoIIIJ protein YidD
MGTLAAQFTDSAIGAYQRYLSPYKGFCCAYRAHTGKRSCSNYGRAIVQKLGLIAFLAALPRQFERCKLAYQKLLAKRDLIGVRAVPPDTKKKKSNDWVDCSPCDVLNAASNLPCDAAPCDCSI